MNTFIFSTAQPAAIPDVIWPATEGNLGKIIQRVNPKDQARLEETRQTGQYIQAKMDKWVWADARTGMVGEGKKYDKPQYVLMSEFLEFNKQRREAAKKQQIKDFHAAAIAASGFGETARIGDSFIDVDNRLCLYVFAN